LKISSMKIDPPNSMPIDRARIVNSGRIALRARYRNTMPRLSPRNSAARMKSSPRTATTFDFIARIHPP
jgi:hypothetical protein